MRISLQDPDPMPLMIQNPAKHLEHAAKAVVAVRYYDIPAGAIEEVADKQTPLQTTAL